MLFQTIRFSTVAVALQLLFLVMFGVFVRYPELGLPPSPSSTNGSAVAAESDAHNDVSSSAEAHGVDSKRELGQSYPFFQDIHVMIFIGFGFLMTFLKRYGFGAVGLNMLVAALVLQWATLTAGWILHFEHHVITVTISDIIGAEFAAAAVLISFGAVLGKVNSVQLLLMALIEVVLFQLNEKVVFYVLQASDIGDSMVVHAFGAYFGLTVARVLFKRDVHEHAEEKEGSVYHSDLFAMIGTIFLWLFWPSFNSVAAVGEGQYRAVINTYFALAACAVVTFAVSAAVEKGKFNMVHIQNATLAGGVAVGTMADMIIEPWAAILIGSIAALLSVVGYRFITPLLSKIGVHDTCGVHNLHGMPGVMSGIGGIICAWLATTQLYGNTLTDVFPARATITAGEQAGRQAAALGVSVAMAIVGGLATGLLLRIPVWDQPKGEDLFDDTNYWAVPPGIPSGSSSTAPDDVVVDGEMPINDKRGDIVLRQ